MEHCRSCGSELNPQYNFCPKCGFRTLQGEKRGVKTPRERRPEWEDAVEEALETASNLLEEAVESAREAVRQALEEIREEVGRSKEGGPSRVFCPECGRPNPGDSVYCSRCGRRLRPGEGQR